MKGDHVFFSPRPLLRGLLAAAALGLVWVSAGAQPISPGVASNSTAGFGAWYFGGGARVGASGSNVAPMPTRPTNPANLSGWVPAGNYGLAPGATGVTVNAQSDFPVPGNGKTVPVNASSKLDAPKLGKAVGNFLKKTVAPLALGLAAYDLAKELGFDLSREDGQLVVQKRQAGSCTVAPCYEYSDGQNVWYKTTEGACRAIAARGLSGYPVTFEAVLTNTTCRHRWHFNNTTFTQSVQVRQRAPDAVDLYDPSSVQELEDWIAQQSGWPSSSAVARAARDALQAGEPLGINSPTVSGPASVQGPKTTTQNSDGSSQTKQSVTNITYAGDTITYNTTVTTTNINAAGETTDTTTETTEEEKPPEDLCTKNPDVVGCQKLGDVPTEEIPRSTKTVTYTPESLFSAGSCPSPVVFDAAKGYEYDYAPLCDILANQVRYLVLALAAFTAMLIVTGIKDQ